MSAKENPCRTCDLSAKYGKYHTPSYKNGCDGNLCEKLNEHKKYLQSKRQFVPGEVITDLDELFKQKWVIWYGYTKHIEMFKSMPLRAVLNFLQSGAFRKAVKR